MNQPKPKLVFLHRYGLEGWVCCGGHAVPGLMSRLADDVELHFWGPETTEPHDPALRQQVRVHRLPFTWNRANPRDKVTKTLLWYFWLPWVGMWCRWNGVRLVWNDETVPFTGWILRLFYGRQVALTVMDFFLRIYTEKHPRLRRLGAWLESLDVAIWRRLPLLFTKVMYTQVYLAARGVPAASMRLFRNPVDHQRFHPVDSATRLAVRQKWGYTEDDVVLTHHGILHPNKGNDWVLRQIAAIRSEVPHLRWLLIGDGPERASLEALAESLGLGDCVRFAGWLPTEQALSEALTAADIGLVMRIGQETDHFHMTDTLAHELACGKPILSVNLRGIEEVIEDGKNGFLFAPDDPAGFQSRLRQLYADARLRHQVGAAALALSHAIGSVDTCAEQLAEALREGMGDDD
jgi:glycosyltransferase involved in cell wall biosynthesis